MTAFAAAPKNPRIFSRTPAWSKQKPGEAWDSTATPFEETNLESGYFAPTQSGAESM